jgi:hypothetical protein
MFTTVPGFKKGMVVTPTTSAVTERRFGTRKANPTEIEAWYKAQYARAPHDDAGESWIHSGTTGVELTTGMRLEVLRGRCTARSGWHTMKGYCEVKDMTSGLTFSVDRRWMAVV